MPWEFVVALIVAIPVVLIPVAFVWFLNLGGVQAAAREACGKRGPHKEIESKSKTGSAGSSNYPA